MKSRLTNLYCLGWRLPLGAIVAALLSLTGCAAFHPIEGIPARFVPEEIRAASRSGKKTIDLSLLCRTQPEEYRLDTGDVLAVYVEGVLPRPNELPPTHMPVAGEEAAPALGYPIPVRHDGSISLPLLTQPLTMRGLTVKQAEQSVRAAYTTGRRILQSGNERVWVILHKPRLTRVLVLRQEGADAATVSGQPGQVNLGALKRGTGKVVSLAGYKNDVLHAIAETGGLPGLDAENAIYVIRTKRESHASSGVNVGPPGSTKFAVPPQSQFRVPANPGTRQRALSQMNRQAAPGRIVRGQSPEPFGSYTRWPGQHIKLPVRQADFGVPAGTPTNRVQPANETVPNAAAGNPNPAGPVVIPLPDSSPAANPNPAWPPNPSPVTPAPMPSAVLPPAANIPPNWPAAGWPPNWQPDAFHVPGAHATSASLGQNLPEMTCDSWMRQHTNDELTIANPSIVKIPVRLGEDDQIDFTQQDIILEDGDIVFIESRDTEIFYTGGLLGGGQYTLPRDYDLDVLGAIAIAQAGRQQGGGSQQSAGGITALNSDVTISGSELVILRKMANGTQVPIKVDLYRAVRHPQDRILIQPGDYLLLQYTPLEAVGAFFERHLLEGALFGLASTQLQSGGGR